MARFEELKAELAATLKYAEEVAEKLEDATIGELQRKDLESELEAVETKAEGLKHEIKEQEKTDARELRIRNIGRETGVVVPTDEQPVQYASAIDMLLEDSELKSRLGKVAESQKARDQRFDTGVLEFKQTDPEVANPGDLIQFLRPGIITPFVYPRRLGPLFAQSAMDGSSVSWLFVPTGTDGGADYVEYAGQKPGGSTELDIDTVKAAKIAAIYTCPDDALDDVAALRGTLQQMLMVGPGGVEQKAEAQYILGSGTGTPLQIAGIDSLSPDDVSGTGDNPVKDVLAGALEIEENTGFPATAVAINPGNVFEIMTLEPLSGDGRPLFSPFGGGYRLPDIGFPWVITKGVPKGTLYVGAWNTSILYTRQAVNIRATSEGIGLADKNLTMFVAETRQALVHPYGAATYRTVAVTS